MKKFMMALCVALVSMGASAQEYYEEGPAAGDWGVGMDLVMGSGSGLTNFGVSPKIQYYLAPSFRMETAFTYFIETKHTIDWDLNLNFHFLIPMKYGLSIYPVLGATFLHRNVSFTSINAEGIAFDDNNNEGRFGLNAGVGVQYDIAPDIYADLEFKYQYVSDFDRANIHIGIGYRF